MDADLAGAVTTAQRRLDAWGTQSVLCAFVDNAGVTRAKLVPASTLASLCATGVGISPVLDVYTVLDHVATDGRFITGPTGDLRLRADPGSLRRFPAGEDYGWVALDQYDQSGEAFPGCQRRALTREIGRLAARGLFAQVGFELEWTVFEADGETPVNTGPAYGAAPLVASLHYLRHVEDALATAGVPAEQVHAEYGNGQFELSGPPMTPLDAADAWVLCRELVREVGRQHGYRTSFSPVPLLDRVGNGAHLHVSVHDRQGNVLAGDGPHGLGQTGAHWLAGAVGALPALRLLAAPGPLSPLRLRPANWAGAYACWGVENREAALRLVVGGQSTNVEAKFGDASMNPYLFLAGLFAAGRRGIDERLEPPEPVEGDPAAIPGGDRPALLPHRIDEAIEAFEAAPYLHAALGPDLVDAFLTVRRAELKTLQGVTDADLVALLRWRY